MKTNTVTGYGLSVIQCPTGKYIFVGSVPEDLLIEGKTKLGLPTHNSQRFDSKEDAIEHARSKGYIIISTL